MSQELPLIWIKKIVRRDGQIINIEDDVIRKADVKRIRRWHKNDKDESITGDITLVTVENVRGIPLVNIQVNESLESLTKRLGNVDQITS
jgi:hypothetical protein